MGRCWNFWWGGHPKAVNYQSLLSDPPCATARRFSMGRCWNFWWGGHPKAVTYQGLLSTPPTSKSCKLPGSALYTPLCHCETVFDGSILEFLWVGTSKSRKLLGSAAICPLLHLVPAFAWRFLMGRMLEFLVGGHPKTLKLSGFAI